MYDFVRPSNSDGLGQYYTNEIVSTALISSLPKSTPKVLFDLGAGSGSLSIAARNKWQSAKIVTLDIQPTSETSIKRVFSNEDEGLHTHKMIDALDFELPSILKQEIGTLDVGISNPPFIKAKWERRFEGILEEARISSMLPSLSDATTDILFLAQMLRIVDKNGYIGLIVPDGMITGARYHQLRTSLVRDFNLAQVTKLPRNAFQGTDAQAYIITFDFRNGGTRNLIVNELNSLGHFSENIEIERDHRLNRLDYSYVSALKNYKPKKKGQITLEDLGCEIVRGKFSTADVKRNVQRPIFHTSNILKNTESIQIGIPKKFKPTKTAIKNGHISIQKGDIVLARVDRSLEKKIAYVKSGEALISDCVFRLRVPYRFRAIVFRSLTSEEGRNWIKSRSQGVSATMISKTQLLKFSVDLKGNKK